MRYKEISEAINYSRFDNLSGYAKDISSWCYNEVPLHWDDDDINAVRLERGNVSVGVVYRGAKINTEAQLHRYQALVNGGQIDARLVSATPHLETAKSFAWYVKSYDELTSLRALSDSVEHGSAGKFGTVVLTLKPRPENVIFKTWTTGTETAENAHWIVSDGPESEVMLHGSVEVVSAKIYPVLTRETWQQDVLKSVNDVSDLDNDFVTRWIRHHKIDPTPIVPALIRKVIRKPEDIIDLLNLEHSFITHQMCADIQKIKAFVQKHYRFEPPAGVYCGDKVAHVNPVVFGVKTTQNTLDHLVNLLSTFGEPSLEDLGSFSSPIIVIENTDRAAISNVGMILTLYPALLTKVKKINAIATLRRLVMTIVHSIVSGELPARHVESECQEIMRWFWVLDKVEQHQIRATVVQYVLKDMVKTGPMDEKTSQFVKYEYPGIIRGVMNTMMKT